MRLEKPIENEILCYLKLKGIVCWKNNSTGIYDPTKGIFRKNKNPHVINGVSDILGILPDGRFLAIEVKSKSGRPSDAQTAFLEKIASSKGVAFIARSLDDVNTHLGKYLQASF